jgi:hypothetical protein
MDTNWAQGTLICWRIDWRFSRFYHIEWLASTRIPDGKGGSVYRDRYECYRVGTELHMGGRRCGLEEEILHGKLLSYKALINVALTGYRFYGK